MSATSFQPQWRAKPLSTVLLFMCFSCSATDITDSAHVAGMELQLASAKDKCELRVLQDAELKILSLKPEPPCFFLRRGADEPQRFSYPKVNIDYVLLVAGSALNERQRTLWNLPEDMQCGSMRQGVLVKAGQIEITPSVIKDSVACKNTGADEKDFWAFAHL
ncbi:hypothetical protein [Bowmanella pacifica]|uniref:Lipoprotein n=1 Tax=Bowmanella pacifica TaxID=502051 RepID=A0A918DHN6_9ALTE|nr:hypothetical protein [Bowmanella pacifica]GGO67625.1 hypothetical protein GCM10010982_14530 [Bowmanella pacifica]